MENLATVHNVPEINLNKQIEINLDKVEEMKEVIPMKNLFHTESDIVAALTNAGVPTNIAEFIGVGFTVTDLRKYVESDDKLSLQMIKGVGDKRAEQIINALKGKIAAPMSQACPDVAMPDVTMHKVPGMTLVMEDKAKLSKNKYKNGKVVLDNDGNSIKNVALKRFGPALQKLQQIEGERENIVFTTVSEIAEDWKDPIMELELKAYWHQLTKYGIIMPDGEVWISGMMGTNAKMKNQIHWIRLKSKAALRKWMACGANFEGKKVNIAKTEAYFGLLIPYTKELYDNKLNPSMEALIPEWEKEHTGKNTLINPDGSMEKKESFTVNEFDGMAVLEELTDEDMNKMGLSRAEKRRLKRIIAKFKGGTLRAPWHKGVLVVGFHLREALKDEGVTEWNGKPVDDIYLWGDMSVFKASIGEDGLYEKFEDFTTSFINMNHRYGVLLENHGIKETFLPAQQLQAAHGCDVKYIEQGAEEEVAYLNRALDPKEAAIRYEPNVIARIAQDDPTIMATWFAMEMACNGYQKEYLSSRGGRTHGENRTGFVVKDLIAFEQWIAYCAGVRKELPTGCLKAYEVFAPGTGLVGEAVASRNPVIANYGLPIVNVIDTIDEEYAKYFDEDFGYIMVSIHDDLCKLLRMDHDGDKMRLTFDRWFINAVKSIDKTGEFAEWTGFGTVDKVELNDETEAEFWDSCTTSPRLGLNVDACSKLIANGNLTTLDQNMVADYMMNKGTDVKQGADGSNVGGDAGVIWKEMKEANKDRKISRAMACGKMQKGRVIDAKDVETEFGMSNLDIISKAVAEKATRTLSYPGRFDVRKVMFGNSKAVQKLCGAYKAGEEWKRGLFDEQVARNKEMWTAMDENAKTVGLKEFLAWQKNQVMKEYAELAAEQNLEMSDVYDTLVTYIFDVLRKKIEVLRNEVKNAENAKAKKEAEETLKKRMSWFIVLARTFIQWFGDTMYDVYCTNNDLGFLPVVDQPIEMEEDIFE